MKMHWSSVLCWKTIAIVGGLIVLGGTAVGISTLWISPPATEDHNNQTSEASESQPRQNKIDEGKIHDNLPNKSTGEQSVNQSTEKIVTNSIEKTPSGRERMSRSIYDILIDDLDDLDFPSIGDTDGSISNRFGATTILVRQTGKSEPRRQSETVDYPDSEKNLLSKEPDEGVITPYSESLRESDIHTPSFSECKQVYDTVCSNIRLSEAEERQKLKDDELKSIFANASEEIEPLKYVQSFYEACINKASVDNDDMQTLRKIIEYLGGWSVLSEGVLSEEIFAIIIRLAAIGYDTFWTISVELHKTIRTSFNIELEIGTRSSILYNYFGNGGIRSYINRMIKFMSMLGVDSKAAKTAIADCIEVAKIIRRHNVDHDFESGEEYEISELQRKYPWFNWFEYLSAVLPPHIQLTKHDNSITIDGVGLLDVMKKEVFDKVQKKKLANYLFMRFIDDLLSFIDTPDPMADDEKNDPKARSQRCANFVATKLPLAIDALHIRNGFTNNTLRHVAHLVKSVRNQTAITLEKFPIPHNETLKTTLSNKAKNIKVLIRNPIEFMEDTEVKKYYKGLVMRNDDFLGGFFNFTKYRLNTLKTTHDLPKFWTLSSRKLLLDSHSSEGMIPVVVIPAILLQTEFDVHQSMFLNYAGIGRDISEMFVRAAVSQINVEIHDHLRPLNGLLFCQGTFLKKHLYNEIFDILPEAYVQQYYERISLKSSYAAYRQWPLKDHGDFDYNPKQLFWRNAMLSNCLQSESNMAVIANANFIDLPEFQEDFECPDLLKNASCEAL